MRIELVRGDITEQRVDAIVKTVNSSFRGGGGERLSTGQAVATGAGELPARWVINTVSPVYSTSEERAATLASCYSTSLRVAADLGATTIAFPAVSTGANRWPIDDAARVALSAVSTADTTVALLRFVLFDRPAYDAFAEAARTVGPMNEQVAVDLAAQPTDRWQELFDLADRSTPADAGPEWRGGERLEDGALSVPYPVYSESVEAILDRLRTLGVIHVFDWATWVRVDPHRASGHGLADGTIADAARLATRIVRQERFADGTIARALADGTFHAVLTRLRHWYEHER